jgi:hypothetical protein
MAISITRYVDIISSVGAGSSVPRRSLTGRIFTQNELVPTDGFISFTNAAEVGSWFGTSSPEYSRAVYYFGWVSKNGTIPPSIDYARYVTGATFPQIFGNIQPQSISLYNTITGGTMGLTLGDHTANFSAFDFTAAASLSDVAAILQTSIRAAFPSIAVWSAATVVFDPVRGSFNLQGGSDSAPAVIQVTEGTFGQPIGNLLGWVAGPTLIVSDGVGATAPQILGNIQSQSAGLYTGTTDGSFTLTIGNFTQALTGIDFTGDTTLANVAGTIQNSIRAITDGGTQWTSATVTYDTSRGSFNFLGGEADDVTISVQEGVAGTPIGNTLGWVSGPTLVWVNGLTAPTPLDAVIASAATSNNFGSFLFIDSLSLDDITAIAQWNSTQNVAYIYHVPVLNETLAIAYTNVLSNFAGTEITLAPLSTEYPEQFPMMIEAATNYDQPNSVQNYMYQQSSLTPSVMDDVTANFYDGLRVNYYGVTQTAGSLLAFYQRGLMQGPASAPQFLNIYANESWLKDAMQSSLINLLLTQNRVSANAQGQSQILAVLQSVIEEATNNGTISANKTLTPSQKAFVTSTTGDPNAWYQVQTIGYWVNCVIVPYTNSNTGLTEYKAEYTLIYSKDDDINLITGQQVLI